jgi:hypothetical protein
MTVTSLEHMVSAGQATEAFLLTADVRQEIQINHIRSLERTSEGQWKVKGWFLPEVMLSLKEGALITVLLFNAVDLQCYQIQGACERIRNIASLDGIAPIEEKERFPQIEWELTLQPETIREIKRI